MPNKVIEVRDLCFLYEKKHILKNINFDINCGEYVAIVGENGSGKSTLLNLMLENLKPSKGKVHLHEVRMGYLSQQVRNFNKKFPATVEEIIAANLYEDMGILKVLTKRHKKRIQEVLEIVDMVDYKKRLIGNLSGGQQQRVFIARLLVNNPRVIFMDEPIVGLDDSSIKAFYELMDKLNHEFNITIVMVTHDRLTMEESADKIISLKNTEMILIEPKKKVKKNDIIKDNNAKFINQRRH